MIRSVSILIPTHNRHELLAKTLESLRGIDLPSGVQVDLLIVANACTDDTPAVAEAGCSRFTFPARCIAEPKPGLNVARNRAIDESTGELIAFLDDDVKLDKTWLTGLLATYESMNADMVGGRVCLWWEAVEKPPWVSRTIESMLSSLDFGTENFQMKNPIIIGANYSFKRSLVDKVGRFREGLDRTGNKLLAGGDTEYTLRAMEAKFRVVYAGNSLVHHWVPPQRLQLSYLRKIAYENGRARVFVKSKFGPRQALRTLAGHIYLWIKFELHHLWALIRFNRRDAVEASMRRRTAWGTIVGVFQRIFSRKRPA